MQGFLLGPVIAEVHQHVEQLRRQWHTNHTLPRPKEECARLSLADKECDLYPIVHGSQFLKVLQYTELVLLQDHPFWQAGVRHGAQVSWISKWVATLDLQSQTRWEQHCRDAVSSFRDSGTGYHLVPCVIFRHVTVVGFHTWCRQCKN
jgi:hypothetical protein